MPTSYQRLRTLPGIGDYTAGAISSIAYGEKVPAVDGNVLRVISRIIGSYDDVLLPQTKKKITQVLQKTMPEAAGEFNEALMELGELVCTPNGKPFCEKCPLQEICLAYRENKTEEIPVRKSKKNKIVEEKTVFIMKSKNKIAIQRRSNTGLLAGMYEFPNWEGKLSITQIKNLMAPWGITQIKQVGEHTHVFTHKKWHMIAYEIMVEIENPSWQWETMQEIKEHYPLPTAFQVFLKKI